MSDSWSLELVDELIFDLTDRSGFDQVWWSTDEEIREDIRNTWKLIVERHCG